MNEAEAAEERRQAQIDLRGIRNRLNNLLLDENRRQQLLPVERRELAGVSDRLTEIELRLSGR